MNPEMHPHTSKVQPSGMVSRLVKVRFTLDEGFAGETLWAEEEENGMYRLRNAPFYVRGYAEDDIVSCKAVNETLEVIQLRKDSGNGTLWILFAVYESSEKQGQVLDELMSIGCSYERSSSRFVAVTVPKSIDVSFSQLLNYLDIEITNAVIQGWEVAKSPLVPS